MMQALNKNVIMDIQSKERRFEMSSGFSSKEPLEKQSLKITKKCLISIFTQKIIFFKYLNFQGKNRDSIIYFWRENSNIFTY